MKLQVEESEGRQPLMSRPMWAFMAFTAVVYCWGVYSSRQWILGVVVALICVVLILWSRHLRERRRERELLRQLMGRVNLDP